jgi:hypothetical protein
MRWLRSVSAPWWPCSACSSLAVGCLLRFACGFFSDLFLTVLEQRLIRSNTMPRPFWLGALLFALAERVGFEPTVPCSTTHFECVRFGLSRTSPGVFMTRRFRLKDDSRRRRPPRFVLPSIRRLHCRPVSTKSTLRCSFPRLRHRSQSLQNPLRL